MKTLTIYLVANLLLVPLTKWLHLYELELPPADWATDEFYSDLWP